MLRRNKSLIEKADLRVSDLSTDGGLLNPEQAARFIRKLIRQPTIIREARVVEMTSPQRNINKIQFNKRIMRPGTVATALPNAAVASGTAFDPADPGTGEFEARAKVLTEQVQLNTSEVIAEVHLPYDVIEDNIERGNIGRHQEGGSPAAGGGIIDTIMTLMAERAALDFEELALLGDTTLNTADPYLDLQDGFLKRVEDDGNVANQTGALVSKATFKSGKKTLPDQFLRNISQLRHYISFDQETEYRDTLADRATGLGDSTLTGNAPVFSFGSPVVPVSLMPEARGLFTNPLNLIWGVQRQVTMEFDKNISQRVFIIVISARVAIQVEEATAAVTYTNIGS